jgi:enolase
MKITHIDALQIFDSRGNPTIEAIVTLDDGSQGHGLVPSGASTGQFEAHELRDKDPNRFAGKSVDLAIANIRHEISDALLGMSAQNQHAIDTAMIDLDGTQDKSRLGANAILGVSMAVANAWARSRNMPLFESLSNGQGVTLPLPEIQIFGGGAHANWRTDLQDWLLIATGASSYAETLEITFNVYRAAGEILKSGNALYGCADEGGYWPAFSSNEEAFDIFAQAVNKAGYTLGKEASLSLDIAASDLYDERTQQYMLKLDQKTYDPDKFIDQLIKWCRDYKVVSIEDPAADTDWDSWRRFHKACGHELQIIGDDLFTTNPARISRGIEQNIANSVLIKLNQIGTVTETIEAIELTQKAGWAPVVSARSGETEDAFISHLAVATNAGQLKVGSFTRSERMVKWNECLRIERHLGSKACFKGAHALTNARG